MNSQTNSKMDEMHIPNKEILHKEATGVKGLDEIFNGGIPKERTTLISGGPGTGKTIFGLKYLHHWATEGEPGIFITFEERGESIRRNVASLGWDLNLLEKEGKLFIFDARLDPNMAISGDFNLTGLLSIIEGKASAMGAKRIVIDALDMLLYHFNNPVRERNEIYALHDWILNHKFTSLITVKTSSSPEGSSKYEFMDFMADCVIHLSQHVDEKVSSRRLRVIKYRGSDFGNKEYNYSITSNGIEFIPISSFALEYTVLGDKISTGIQKLDNLLYGGIRRGSTVLIAGTAGVGKTTMACTFIRAAFEKKQKAYYISFEESEAAMLDTMLSPGIDLRPGLNDGLLKLRCDMPESIESEKHLLDTFKNMTIFDPSHVVIDAISACKRMGHDKIAFDYILRIIHFCKRRGSTCMLINQTLSFRELEDVSGIGLSSLTDMIVFLRFLEDNWVLRRALLILKARGSQHSNRYHEFQITNNGIEIIGTLGEMELKCGVRGGR